MKTTTDEFRQLCDEDDLYIAKIESLAEWLSSQEWYNCLPVPDKSDCINAIFEKFLA